MILYEEGRGLSCACLGVQLFSLPNLTTLLSLGDEAEALPNRPPLTSLCSKLSFLGNPRGLRKGHKNLNLKEGKLFLYLLRVLPQSHKQID